MPDTFFEKFLQDLNLAIITNVAICCRKLSDSGKTNAEYGAFNSMSNYDLSIDDDTKIIPIQGIRENSVVMLPDGKQPVQMASGVICGVLGEGGMAIVYEIWNEQLGVGRAVKLLRPNSPIENIERFDTEMKVTAQLDHQNIIKIHSVGKWNGLPYIEMEMIDGMSLDEMIKKQGALPVVVCTSIAIIICRALKYTHHHEYAIKNESFTGLLHRDLKPGNILISHKGIIRLTDFGVATPTTAQDNTSTSGKVIGSMKYMAPEQLDKDEIDTSADIFSLGCILYEMLTGSKTFPEQNLTKLVRKRLKNEFNPLSSFKIVMPQALNRTINNCLQLQPEKRPSDIKNVLGELTRIHRDISSKTPDEIMALYLNGESVEDSNDFPDKPHFPFLKIMAATLSIILVVGVVLLVVNISDQKQWRTIQARTKISTPLKQSSRKKINISNDKPIVSKSVISEPVVSEPVVSTPVNKEKPKVKKKKIVARKKKRIPIRTLKKQKTITTTAEPDQKVIDRVSGSDSRKSLLEKLQIQHNTQDFIVIMRKEDENKHHWNVLEICKSLPRAQANIKEARLLKHRALVALKKVNKSYFDNNHINDGEFYLSKAQYLYNARQYQRSVWILGIIKTAPTVLLNKKTLHRKVLYLMAKCNTKSFYKVLTKDKKKTAMKSWYNVKSEFRNNQKHAYFIEANKEIRNINKEIIE